VEESDLLLDLLNSRPLIDGVEHDELADPEPAAAWTSAHGGTGDQAELHAVRRARDLLTQATRGSLDPGDLAPLLRGVRWTPEVTGGALTWHLECDAGSTLAPRAVLAWFTVRRDWPGRLRPCGNDECRLFLLDRSNANKRRWCSMAVCGNRLKAQRHYRKHHQPDTPQGTG
jgi:predicted RNA-binding Zn ribbon-like protein